MAHPIPTQSSIIAADGSPLTVLTEVVDGELVIIVYRRTQGVMKTLMKGHFRSGDSK